MDFTRCSADLLLKICTYSVNPYSWKVFGKGFGETFFSKKVSPIKKPFIPYSWDERTPWCHPNCRSSAAAFPCVKGHAPAPFGKWILHPPLPVSILPAFCKRLLTKIVFVTTVLAVYFVIIADSPPKCKGFIKIKQKSQSHGDSDFLCNGVTYLFLERA